MTPGRWQQVEELYHAAQERGSQALAGAHPELRKEVESLLAQQASLPALATEATITVFATGSQLGPYKIEAPIGVGGMGEVFRATDTRLHRTVAIKILPRQYVADPERKRRFLQEARAASALNHPNIVTLHDIANDNGTDYLVMEYVAGKSLDKLIPRKGLPFVDAIGYTVQIANALSAAHAAGVVHRDIKPANVIVTTHGQVKVLDFGLAKLTERAHTADNETQKQESVLTEAGTVMGTVAYMSPEQASAEPLDHRTDIFSLGIVLYEMLSGERPFRGKSHVETMHAIIHDPVTPLTNQSPALEEVFAKALSKDLHERYQHSGDLAIDLRRVLRKPAEVTTLARRRFLVLPWAAAVLAIGIPFVWWAVRPGQPSAPENPLDNAKFVQFTDFPGDEIGATISPDGRFVAFLSDRDGPFDLFVSQVGTGRFTNLTEGRQEADLRNTVRAIGFSGDGSEIWYRGAGQKRRPRLVPLIGGEPHLFMGERVPYMAWSPDGGQMVYHTNEEGDPIFVADRTGANARLIFKGGHNHNQTWSPDGKWLYFSKGLAETTDLWRIPSAGGDAERLTQHNTRVDFPTPIDNRTVLYTALDQDGSGPWLWYIDMPTKVTRRASFGLEQYSSVATSADGRHVVASVSRPTANLWTVPILDRVAEERDVKPFPVGTIRAFAPRYGGQNLFYLSSRGSGDGLWRYRERQSFEIWNGADGALSDPAALSVDGNRVAIIVRKDRMRRLQVGNADGTEFHVIGETIDVLGDASWSPDGKWVVVGSNDSQDPGLFKVPVDGGAPVRIISDEARDPIWSPDGQLIVYVGEFVSSMQPLRAIRPDGTRVELPDIRVSARGERARFTSDGKALVYMAGAQGVQDFWLLDLATRKTRQLTHLTNTATMRTFDITLDGKQIVFDRLRDNSDIVLMNLPEKAK